MTLERRFAKIFGEPDPDYLGTPGKFTERDIVVSEMMFSVYPGVFVAVDKNRGPNGEFYWFDWENIRNLGSGEMSSSLEHGLAMCEAGVIVWVRRRKDVLKVARTIYLRLPGSRWFVQKGF